ncbi:hypothetical protein NDU88_005787 [Pleurodeles waltl]|uniref:Uncharacterized protein n=1 Tax=Pleurodeles waltl TaxID=8319 RepID=A0AAV7W8T2_PLEWA|nr:hypothetical protein NDU88_005787 [Pleurodeles waltl]
MNRAADEDVLSVFSKRLHTKRLPCSALIQRLRKADTRMRGAKKRGDKPHIACHPVSGVQLRLRLRRIIWVEGRGGTAVCKEPARGVDCCGCCGSLDITGEATK